MNTDPGDYLQKQAAFCADCFACFLGCHKDSPTLPDSRLFQAGGANTFSSSIFFAVNLFFGAVAGAQPRKDLGLF